VELTRDAISLPALAVRLNAKHHDTCLAEAQRASPPAGVASASAHAGETKIPVAAACPAHLGTLRQVLQIRSSLLIELGRVVPTCQFTHELGE
jgi:hypothetical protein